MIEVELKNGEIVTLVKYHKDDTLMRYKDSKGIIYTGMVNDIQSKYLPLKVKVKQFDEIKKTLDWDSKFNGILFSQHYMKQYCGQEQEIQSILIVGNYKSYNIDGWYFIEDWLDFFQVNLKRSNLRINPDNQLELEEGLFI